MKIIIVILSISTVFALIASFTGDNVKYEEYMLKLEEDIKIQEDEKNELKILNMHCDN